MFFFTYSKDGRKETKKITNLHVLFLAGGTKPSITPAVSPWVVDSGQELKLVCRDDGPVTWDFQNTDPSAKPKKSGNKEFYIRNARARDTGTYTCKTKESNSSIYVFVKGKLCVFILFLPLLSPRAPLSKRRSESPTCKQ